MKQRSRFGMVRTALRYTGIIIGLTVFCYLFLCFVLAAIPVAKEKTNDERCITVYLFKGGVHTDFMVPVHTPTEDWSQHFPYSNNKVVDTTFRWIRIGFGDKAFFSHLPDLGRPHVFESRKSHDRIERCCDSCLL